MPNKWRRDSIFGPGRRIPLDREAKAQIRAKLKSARRPGWLTQTGWRIGEYLVRTIGADGQLDPSVETIRIACQCGRSAVFVALKMLKGLGFLAWENRIVRNGWRVDQTSNAYVLSAPDRESGYRTGVSLRILKKERSAPMTDQDAYKNAARMLAAFGMRAPRHWPAPAD